MNIDYLIDNYGSYIYNYALKLCCHPTTAEDLAQETFIKAWEKADQLTNADSAKAWLRKICLNIFLMKMRKEQRCTEVFYADSLALEKDGSLLTAVSQEPTPEDEILVDESIRDLQNGCFLAMVRRLTLSQRITFSLVDMFGLSIDEVSDLLECSKSAVKGLLYRARMNLDSFFHSRCNLIETSNPCSCEAWKGFVEHRNNIQNEVLQKKLVTSLDYTKHNYIFNSSVRRKVQYLYKNMPERKPNIEWYKKVISLISEMYSPKNS